LQVGDEVVLAQLLLLQALHSLLCCVGGAAGDLDLTLHSSSSSGVSIASSVASAPWLNTLAAEPQSRASKASLNLAPAALASVWLRMVCWAHAAAAA
jgi:hypothetical protein